MVVVTFASGRMPDKIYYFAIFFKVMNTKSATVYHWVSGVVIAAWFLLLVLHYSTANDWLDKLNAHLSIAQATRWTVYLGWAVLVYCLLKITLLRKSVTEIMLLTDSVLLVFVAANVFLSVFHFSISAQGCYMVSENTPTPDSISGYRYFSGKHRQVYVFRNRKVFDVVFSANNEGYVSDLDFYKKKTKQGKRWIVLGDSFTSENYNETNWVNRINHQLSKDLRGQNELYSFSIEGIGATTWHSIFFKEILNQYEFDGLILPIYYEDIYRAPIVLYGTASGVNCVYLDSISGKINPATAATELGGEQIALKVDTGKIDSLIKAVSTYQIHWPGFYPALVEEYILPLTASVIQKLKKDNHAVNTSAANTDSVISFIKATPEGAKGLQYLREIVSACNKLGKPVIICSIPDNNAAELKQASGINQQTIVSAVAAHLGTQYFSGYKDFEFLNYENAPQYFHADGHWNTKGSAIFANAFYSFMKVNNYLPLDSTATVQSK